MIFTRTLSHFQVKVVKFLGSGMMEPMEAALPLVVAAADTRHSVASQGGQRRRGPEKVPFPLRRQI